MFIELKNGLKEINEELDKCIRAVGGESSISPACYEPDSTKANCVRLITECLQGHGLGHNNTPEKWADNAEQLYDMVHKAVTGS